MDLNEITKAVLTKIAARETPPTHQEIIALTIEEALENLTEFKEDVRLNSSSESVYIDETRLKHYRLID